jgi:cytochrome c oxidase subunit IV
MSTTTHGEAVHGHGHGAEDDGEVHAHISSTQFYVGVLGALLFLTFLTVLVSYFDFGQMNVIIAVVIATIKASLVAAFFMHLRHDRIFNTIAFLAAFLFLSIFLLLTRDDLYKRAEIDPAYGGHTELRSGMAAPGGMPSSAPAPAESGAPSEKH